MEQLGLRALGAPAKWRVCKFYRVWAVYRPSAAWGVHRNDGWAGDFETWDEAMRFATDADYRLAWYDEHCQGPDDAYRFMWVEGLVL